MESNCGRAMQWDTNCQKKKKSTINTHKNTDNSKIIMPSERSHLKKQNQRNSHCMNSFI